MFQFKANTPEELKSAIVKWLKDCSIHHRSLSRNAVRVAIRVEELILANAYEDIGNFIERSEVTKS